MSTTSNINGVPVFVSTTNDRVTLIFSSTNNRWESGLEINHFLDANVTGGTFTNIGSLYLPATTLQAPARIFAGCVSVGDTVEMELTRETGGAVIATWSATGNLQEITQGSNVVIPAADWYHLRPRASAGAGSLEAILRGVHWLLV